MANVYVDGRSIGLVGIGLRSKWRGVVPLSRDTIARLAASNRLMIFD